jgi:hypothetical protein
MLCCTMSSIGKPFLITKEIERKKTMNKILGINSVVMNGSEKTTVTKITSKGVTLKGKKSLTFPLKDVEKQLQAGRWKVVDND